MEEAQSGEFHALTEPRISLRSIRAITSPGAADPLEPIRFLEWRGVVLVVVSAAHATSRHC